MQSDLSHCVSCLAIGAGRMRREAQEALAEEVQLQAERVRLSTRDGATFRSRMQRERQLEQIRWMGEQMRLKRERLRELRGEEGLRQANVQAEIRSSVSSVKAEAQRARAQLLEARQLEARAMRKQSRLRESSKEKQQARAAMARRLARDAVHGDKFVSAELEEVMRQFPTATARGGISGH
eukprot:7106032-Prymnesium_polylepis.3